MFCALVAELAADRGEVKFFPIDLTNEERERLTPRVRFDKKPRQLSQLDLAIRVLMRATQAI